MAAERPLCQAAARGVPLAGPDAQKAPLEGALAIYHCSPYTAVTLHVPDVL